MTEKSGSFWPYSGHQAVRFFFCTPLRFCVQSNGQSEKFGCCEYNRLCFLATTFLRRSYQCQRVKTFSRARMAAGRRGTSKVTTCPARSSTASAICRQHVLILRRIGGSGNGRACALEHQGAGGKQDGLQKRGIMDKIIVSANFFPILTRIGLSEGFLTTFLEDDISEVPL